MSDNNSTPKKKKLSTGAKVGIGCGIAAVVGIILAVLAAAIVALVIWLGNRSESAAVDTDEPAVEEAVEEVCFEEPEPEPIIEEYVYEDEMQVVPTIDIVENTKDAPAEVAVVEEVKPAQPAQEVVTVREEPKKEKIYNFAMVEQKPEFPGGEAAMYKWLGEHINYPTDAAEAGIQGRVMVEFVVSKNGQVQNARVVRGKDASLDKEAVRVVKMMPKWNPGRNNGAPVSVTYTLPVTFKLQT